MKTKEQIEKRIQQVKERQIRNRRSLYTAQKEENSGRVDVYTTMVEIDQIEISILEWVLLGDDNV